MFRGAAPQFGHASSMGLPSPPGAVGGRWIGGGGGSGFRGVIPATPGGIPPTMMIPNPPNATMTVSANPPATAAIGLPTMNTMNPIAMSANPMMFAGFWRGAGEGAYHWGGGPGGGWGRGVATAGGGGPSL